MCFIHVLHVLNMPMDASLARWALFSEISHKKNVKANNFRKHLWIFRFYLYVFVFRVYFCSSDCHAKKLNAVTKGEKPNKMIKTTGDSEQRRFQVFAIHSIPTWNKWRSNEEVGLLTQVAKDIDEKDERA